MPTMLNVKIDRRINNKDKKQTLSLSINPFAIVYYVDMAAIFAETGKNEWLSG